MVVMFLFCAMLGLNGNGGELVRLDGAVLVPARGNDGDSFRISHEGKELTVRLYYVDCPEMSASSAPDARRVREQTRYFGLPGHDRTVHFGREAAAFTKKLLGASFTVHTAHATAPGRSRGGRSYAFVTTVSGEDLAYLLVKQGYARTHGVSRALPDGTPGKEAAARLTDLELAAILDRRGIWAEAEGKRLVALRAAARTEAQELALIKREAAGVLGKINVNTASIDQLEMVDGIGPVFARRIVEQRPIKTVADLDRIPGISGKTLARLLEQITFE
jgi:endonuclease YncB( thermonuclease family)